MCTDAKEVEQLQDFFNSQIVIICTSKQKTYTRFHPVVMNKCKMKCIFKNGRPNKSATQFV